MKKIIIYSAIVGLLLGIVIVFYLLNLEAEASSAPDKFKSNFTYEQPYQLFVF